MSCLCNSNNSGELGLLMNGMLNLAKGSLKGSSNALINDAWRQSSATAEVFIAMPEERKDFEENRLYG